MIYNKINKYIFVSIATLILLIFIGLLCLSPLNNNELNLYDYRALLSTDHSIFKQKYNNADKNIILLGIDDYSNKKLSNYNLAAGRQPWPRHTIADIVNFVNKGKPKAIVIDLFFQGQEGEYPQNIKSDEYFANTLKKSKNVLIALVINNSRKMEFNNLRSKKKDFYINNLGINNNQLDFIIKNQNKIITPSIKEDLGLKINDKLSSSSINNQKIKNLFDNITYLSYNPLFQLFMENANHLGAINLEADEDGKIRDYIPLYKLVTDKGPIYFPSLPLATVLTVIPEKERTPFILTKDKIIIGKRIISINGEGKFLINWHGAGGPAGKTYKYIPISKVILTNSYNKHLIQSINKEDKITPDVFKDKIVVIGQVSSGSDIHATSMSSVYPGPEITATCIDNLLNDTYTLNPNRRNFVFVAPIWINAAILILFCFAIGLINIKSRHNYLSVLWFLTIVSAFILFSVLLFINFRVWINIVYPIIFMFLTVIATYVYKNYILDRDKKELKSLFGRCVSPKVIEKLLNERILISKKVNRKYLTAFFSDIRDFTSLSEKYPEEELVPQLNEYFDEMVKVIQKYDGTLNKFIGDAIMAFWGDPLPVTDHALRATLTAIEMLEALEKLNEKWLKEGKPAFNIGIGINTGEMSVGGVGCLTMIDYTVIGDNVNLASRLEGVNKELGTKIIISDTTYQEVKDHIDVVPQGEKTVKGRHQPVKIYEVKGVKSEKTPQKLT
jgi:adenylate cyclase